MPQPSQLRLTNIPITRPGQLGQEYKFPIFASETFSKTKNESRMRKEKWFPVPYLLNQPVADREDGAPKQDATQYRAQIVNLIQELLQDP